MKLNQSNSIGVLRATCLAALLIWGVGKGGATARAAELPSNLDPAPLRSIPIQQEGRYPPLDTVARDYVESVTGEMSPGGRDPVLLLLGWAFEAPEWAGEPLIRIENAELRQELALSADQTVYSFNELIGHQPLRQLMQEVMRGSRGRKPNPLESKVSDIYEKLTKLDAVFHGEVLRMIPDPQDPLGAWRTPAELSRAESAPYQAVLQAWAKLGLAFQQEDTAAFSEAGDRLSEALAALPAAHRPSPRTIATELRFNRLQPFGVAWKIMVAGAALAAIALIVRKRVFDALAVLAMIAGFAVLTYGLSQRWQIAGRIPAANMFESLLFLSWGMGAFAILSMLLVRDRTVPLTASAMGALALFLADVLPLDHFVRPIPPVLMDTVWMSIHVPVIMVSYSVLALAMLIAHALIVVSAVVPRRRSLILAIDGMHYWYVHVGAILLLIGIVTGSMWAASSWGRYWGWDPKEVWSLIALLGYLTILHVRIDVQRLPAWVYVAGAALAIAVFGIAAARLAPLNWVKVGSMLAAAVATGIFLLARGPFATALKSVLAFWMIIMTYVGVNYVLGIGLHSYGFGTGAVVRYMFLLGGADLAFIVVCSLIYIARRRGGSSTAEVAGRHPQTA